MPNKIYIVSTTHGRDFTICPGLVATPRAQYLVTGKIPDKLRARAQRVTGAQLERLQARVEAKAPIEVQELTEDLARLAATEGVQALVTEAEATAARLTQENEQLAQERDQARQERDHARDELREAAQIQQSLQAEVERLRDELRRTTEERDERKTTTKKPKS
jgi:DNA repair exonuclease SbcCD ATPase subunit